jgi:hypothetical protein
MLQTTAKPLCSAEACHPGTRFGTIYYVAAAEFPNRLEAKNSAKNHNDLCLSKVHPSADDAPHGQILLCIMSMHQTQFACLDFQDIL